MIWKKCTRKRVTSIHLNKIRQLRKNNAIELKFIEIAV